jgi:hypothetical protein
MVVLALAAPVIPASATSAQAGPAGQASVRPVLLPTGDEAILRTTAGGGASASVLPSGQCPRLDGNRLGRQFQWLLGV